jgi:hypothetical protein
MIRTFDSEQAQQYDEAAPCIDLFAAVLYQAVVVDKDLAYLDSSDFRFICGLMGLVHEWVAKKLRQAIANKVPKLGRSRRRRAKRTHSEETRAKIKAAIARRNTDSEAYEAWRAEISEGQKKRWARARRKMEAA